MRRRAAVVVAMILVTFSTAAAAADKPKQVRLQDLPTWNVQITMRANASKSSIQQVREVVVNSSAAQFAELSIEQQHEELVALAGDPPPPGFVLGTQWRVQSRRADRRMLVRQARHRHGVSSARVGSFSNPALGACAQRDKGVRLEAFMNVDATAEEIGAVRAVLGASPVVDRYKFFDKAAALREFKRIFKKDPELVKNITAAELPTSFRIIPTEPVDFDALVTQVEAMPGVDDVGTPEDTFPDLDCERLAAIP